MAIAPEVLAEYSSLTEAGGAAGAGTLRQAEANVASRRAAASAPAPAPGRSRAASGGQQGGGLSGGSVSLPPRALSGPSETAKTITRLVWAVAIGLIVLEFASQATGQFWSFNLQGPGLQKQPYQPLYGPRQTTAALPGMLGGSPGLKLLPGTGGQ